MPKGLKEYQAFNDLKKTIDDFNETCPLLEMMANKSMKERHWARIAVLTNHKFDIDSDNFLLRDIMSAPLLKFKEEIEVNILTKCVFKFMFINTIYFNRIFAYQPSKKKI